MATSWMDSYAPQCSGAISLREATHQGTVAYLHNMQVPINYKIGHNIFLETPKT